jgi:NAD-dependent SIR2 family protein deacetylase
VPPAGQWQDVVGYRAAHKRVRTLHGAASLHRCRHCDGSASDWAYDHSDPDQVEEGPGRTYSLKPEHYIPLCKSCHGKFDKWVGEACPQGHARTSTNTHTDSRGWRSCLPCRRERSLSWQKENPARRADSRRRRLAHIVKRPV